MTVNRGRTSFSSGLGRGRSQNLWTRQSALCKEDNGSLVQNSKVCGEQATHGCPLKHGFFSPPPNLHPAGLPRTQHLEVTGWHLPGILAQEFTVNMGEGRPGQEE